MYSRIQAWSWLADEAEVAVMLDTDLYIKHSLDQAFYKLTHCKVAGAFRGKGDFRLDGPRPASSIKTKAKKDRGQGGGGINGGVVVFAPSEEEAQEMLLALKSYRPPDNSGGEQDFISQHFGLQQQIGQLDIALNYQVHQLSQTAIHDDDDGRWVSLAKRPDEIFISQQCRSRVTYYWVTSPKKAVDGCGKTLNRMLSGTTIRTRPLGNVARVWPM